MKLVVDGHHDRVILVSCSGQITQTSFQVDSDPLKELLGPTGYASQVALDLKKTTYIDSSGLGWVIANYKRFVEGGGKLVLHSASPLVMQVFQLVRLDGVLNMRPNRDSALALFETSSTRPA